MSRLQHHRHIRPKHNRILLILPSRCIFLYHHWLFHLCNQNTQALLKGLRRTNIISRSVLCYSTPKLSKYTHIQLPMTNLATVWLSRGLLHNFKVSLICHNCHYRSLALMRFPYHFRCLILTRNSTCNRPYITFLRGNHNLCH